MPLKAADWDYWDVQVIAELQLDDWAVKEKEIEILRNADGSLCELGHGAFGQVRLLCPHSCLQDMQDSPALPHATDASRA